MFAPSTKAPQPKTASSAVPKGASEPPQHMPWRSGDRMAEPMLTVQRAIGNQAVLRLLRSESEQANSLTENTFSDYQMQEGSGGRTATSHAGLAPVVDEVLRSPGQPLAPSTRALMDSRFGHNFADVRVHADMRAADSARALNAAAFTVGRDIVFGANQYAPDTDSGRELLGHELAHTIQQRNSSGPGPTQQPHGIFETSAAAAGWAVANGQAVSLPLPACGVGLSRAPIYAKEVETAREVLAEGTVWREQRYSNALLTETNVKNRPATLAYSRALMDVEIEMSRKQKAYQEAAPVLDDATERRIGFRRNALIDIVRTKSVRRGLSDAEAKTEDPEEREQIRLVGGDMKLVQDEFRERAFDNSYKLLDASSREIVAMLRSYGVMVAAAGAERAAHYVRLYEGELHEEAAKWLETARGANTSGFSDAEKVQHRKDLNVTLRRLRALQREVKRQQIKHPATAKDATSAVLRATATLVHPSLASHVPGSLAPDHPELKAAKAALAGAWLNAERDHPVLAAYRAGKDDALEDVSLGGRGRETAEDTLDVAIQGAPSLGKKATGGRGGETSETEAMQAVVSQAIRLLTNVLTAKLALQQRKVSPFELAPIVAVTRAQMLIRRGSAWDVAVEELMRGDEGEQWAKEALQVVLSALSLFPPLWPLLIAMAALDIYAAGKAWVRYGLDQALVGTSVDRAKALSTTTPSLAGFAWALFSAGLNVVGARAAFAQAEALSAKVMVEEAEAAEAISELNKLGANHGIAHLGDDVAKARAVTAESRLARPPASHPPVTEESIVAKAGRSRPDRGKIARPFNYKPPKAPVKNPVGLGAGGAVKPVLAATAKPPSAGELMAKAEAMLERLPADHVARNEIAKFIESSQRRLAPIRTQAQADEVLRGLNNDLEKIRSRHPSAFDPAPPVAPAPVPKGVPPPTATAPVPGFDERVLVGGVDGEHRATHVTGELHPADLHSGTPSGRTSPPTELDRPDLFRLRARRGHLLGNLFGGKGTDAANLMWLHRWVNNSSYKTQFENLIADALRRGEDVRFTILPHYRAGEAAPFEVEVWAESAAGTVVPHRTIPTPGLSDLRVPTVHR